MFRKIFNFVADLLVIVAGLLLVLTAFSLGNAVPKGYAISLGLTGFFIGGLACLCLLNRKQNASMLYIRFVLVLGIGGILSSLVTVHYMSVYDHVRILGTDVFYIYAGFLLLVSILLFGIPIIKAIRSERKAKTGPEEKPNAPKEGRDLQ